MNMKLAPMFALSPLLLGLIAWQSPLPELLTTDFAKLGAAKELKVSYTFVKDGDPQGKFELELSKDKLFRLTQPTGFVVSDGQNVYTYTKVTNTYTKAPLTDDELAKFEKRPEVVAWSPFFQKDAESKVESAAVGQERTVRDHHVKEVAYTPKGTKDEITLLVDQDLGIARGFRLSLEKSKYLGSVSDLDVSDAASTADKFAFVAPDGAKLTVAMPAAGATPTYGQVQQLMTDNCMPCHDASNQKAGYDLSAYDGIVSAVTPGKSADSQLVKALRGNGADQMPKGRAPLPDAQIKLIEKWIDAGAKRTP